MLSVLYRLGLDANLPLGNKKSVDITVVLGPWRNDDPIGLSDTAESL